MRTWLGTMLFFVVAGCGDGAQEITTNPDAAALSHDASSPDAAPAERAGTCSGEYMQVSIGNPMQCCQKGMEIWQTLDRKRVAHRRLGPAACRLADGIGTQCGSLEDPVPCFYGPCKTAVPEVMPGSVATIFHPRSDPNACGWDVDGVQFMPEKYDNQETYPGVVATCPYTTCMFPGIPIP